MLERILTVISTLFYCLLAIGAGILFARSEYYDRAMLYLDGAAYALMNFEGIPPIDSQITIWADNPEAIHNGVILLGAQFVNGPAAVLVDNKGQVLHRWHIEKKVVNPVVREYHHIPEGLEGNFHTADEVVLYPDGSLLFSQDVRDYPMLRALRLAKIDKDSNLLWQLVGFFHHDIDVGADGTIYAVGSKLTDALPLLDQTNGKAKFVTGLVRIVSPDGELLKNIDVEEAFLRSDYASYLPLFDIDIAVQEMLLPDGTQVYDPIHLNSVQYVSEELASGFPIAQEGDLLISTRGNSTIALLRPSENTIVWAMRGPWLHQHFARLTPRGTITLYDNDGGGFIAANDDHSYYRRQSRMIEFDPLTAQATTLFYRPDYYNMHSYWRGYYHPLADGSFILSSSETGRVLQIAPDGSVIWELRTVADRARPVVPFEKRIASVKYYDRANLPFLADSNTSGSAGR